MKPKKNTLLMLLLLLFCSCTKIIYTHQQVMDKYHTKKDVVNQFGLPTEKRTGEGIEEWIYDKGTVSTGTGISSNGRISVGVSQFNTYSKYIKFTFDKDGNVMKWDSQGVDLTQRKLQKAATYTLAALLGILIGLIIVGASSN